MNSQEYEDNYRAILWQIFGAPYCEYMSVQEIDDRVKNTIRQCLEFKQQHDELIVRWEDTDRIAVAKSLLSSFTKPRRSNDPMEKFRQSVGLLHYPPSVTIEHIVAHNKKVIQRQEFEQFQAYERLEEILVEWPHSTTTFSEVKFVKPTNLADWQSTIYRCTTMVKVFKTLEQHMAANTHQYNFIYQCKSLYRSTTHIFEYDPQNFAFVIRTGLGNGGQVFKNTTVSFYTSVRSQLMSLLYEMQKELPQSHYEQVIALYTLIRYKQKA